MHILRGKYVPLQFSTPSFFVVKKTRWCLQSPPWNTTPPPKLLQHKQHNNRSEKRHPWCHSWANCMQQLLLPHVARYLQALARVV